MVLFIASYEKDGGWAMVWPLAPAIETIDQLKKMEIEMLAMPTEEILAAVLALDPKTRAEVAHRIIVSLDELSDEESERLWAEEADRRVRELREGRVKEIPGKQVMADARAVLR